MKFANHGLTEFLPTTDHLGQSLINDFFTFINLWQAACDNGYGIVPNWDEKRDLIIESFDWFCVNILKNLVAIAVFIALVAWHGATTLYTWCVASGRVWVHLRLIVSFVGGCAVFSLRVLMWIEETGAPIVLQWCDRLVRRVWSMFCPWLLV
ncbi:hypothetical protein [Leptothoe spongobia]|uniref:Uncharacterized protein n=1 Tax=Leptothoe spongobia TAU-MAC 1115 TaxID=1967444 RepID=A0A947DJ70_9CYAN|nr:hypothetical protein [Leptothoe spongobia]MBT9318046.1 hypothetical protein [Leptothoe spongobia TAU-MAC 1115]